MKISLAEFVGEVGQAKAADANRMVEGSNPASQTGQAP